MSTEPVFNAKLTATDDTSPVVTAIKEHLKALGLEAHKVGDEIKHVHQPGVWSEMREGTHHVGESFGELGEHVSGVGEKIAELVPAIGALGAAGGLVAMLETTEKVADAYGELVHSAQALGVQAEQLHEWNIMAQLSDTNADAMAKSMNRLNIAIADAARGHNKDAARLFAQLHMDPKKIKDSADALPMLADAFQHTHSAAMRASMAAVLFGARAGKEMIPFLMRGSAGLRELQAEAKKLGFNFSESGEGLDHYNESMKRLNVATDGFKDAVASDLAPVLAPLVEDITDIVAANRDWLAQDMAGEVKDIATWIRSVPWNEVGKEVGAWGHDAEWFAQEIGGAKVVVGLLAGSMVVKGTTFLFAETIQAGKFAVEAAVGIARLVAMAAAWLRVGAAATEAAAAEELANNAAGGGVGGAAKAAAKAVGVAGAGEAAAGAGGLGISGAATAAAPVLAAGAVAGVGAALVAAPLAVGLKHATDYIDHATGLDKYERAGANSRSGNPYHIDPPRRGQAITPGHATAAQAAAGTVEGHVAITMTINGAPPGTTVSATATGAAAAPKVELGNAFHDQGYNGGS